MGNIFSGDGWVIKVHGDDHPPIHAHVLHADGKASITVDGTVKNSGVPAKVITTALDWLVENAAIVEAEWTKIPEEFATAKVADFGWTVEWGSGALLDSDRLIEIALEQAGMAENVSFRRWQDANNLSLTDAAKAIGLTRRTVSQYRTGARPVPRIVGLACKGWEVEHRRQA